MRSIKKVGTIKNPDKLREIQEVLEADEDWHGRRMYLMFMVGIYTGLRISDMVRLRAGHVRGDEISLIEEKTEKEQVIPIATILQRVIADRTAGMDDGDYLFPSRQRRTDGSVKPIETRTAYGDMQLIAKRFGLRGPIGCHTLRKTFGYWHYKRNHDLEILRQWFNHASVDVTRRYIGVDVEERRKSVQGFTMGYEPKASAKAQKAKSIPLEVTRQDRSENGRRYGQRAAQKVRQRREK
ncbi:MAG: tyrosine-type recombinase/integrase [Clostridia bacterium]|nr:tyrosine-type recombinase/integrase [Clostridia bacterium]